MKLLQRVKYFIKDIPFKSLVSMVRYVNVFLKFGFHPNGLKGMSLTEIRKDRFIGYLSHNISIQSPRFLHNKNQVESRKIKILFTINSFRGIGGTEIWLLQMLNELSSRGMQCLVFTSHVGEISTLVSDKRILVTSRISDVIIFNPDLIHLQHANNKNILDMLSQLYKKIPIFNLVHGVVPTLELPYQHGGRHIVYGAVSCLSAEKVRFLVEKNKKEVHLIKNFFFQNEIPAPEVGLFLTAAVVSSKISPKQIHQWANLFKKIGIQLDFYGYTPEKFIKDYKDVINKYSFFLCTGKTAIDILGYGKPVILLEENLLGPAVVNDNIHLLSEMNFALASPLINATELEDPDIINVLNAQIENLSRNDFNLIRNYLIKENSMKASADRLVQIYFELIIDSAC